MELIQHLLAQERMSLAVAKIPRRRANKLGDLMTVLKLRTVNLQHRSRVAQQTLRRRFDNPGFAGSCGAEEQEVPDRPVGRGHTRQEQLVDINNLFDCLSLTNDQPPQPRLQVLRFAPSPGRIQGHV